MAGFYYCQALCTIYFLEVYQMKILIIKLRSVGDVLLVTPLIKNLKLNHLNLFIDVLVNAGTPGKGTSEILLGNLNINNIVEYNREKISSMPLLKKIKEEFSFLMKLRSAKYDVVINLDNSERGAYIAFFSGASTRIGLNNKPYINRIYNRHLKVQNNHHTVDFNLQPLGLLGLKIFNKTVEVFWSDTDNVYVAKKLEDTDIYSTTSFIHIHPSSRGVEKCIKNELMAQIIDYCELELNLKAVLTAAPLKDEMERVSDILRLCKSSPVNMSGKLTLLQTAALNKKARLFIGVDTAIMHISAANDTPVLAFFGPTAVDNWGPWDNNAMESLHDRKKGFQEIGKHRIYTEKRDCLPCSKNGCNNSLISDCLMDLDIGFITNQIKDMASENPNS